MTEVTSQIAFTFNHANLYQISANQLESLFKPLTFFEWLLVLLLPEKWYIDKQTENHDKA